MPGVLTARVVPGTPAAETQATLEAAQGRSRRSAAAGAASTMSPRRERSNCVAAS